MRTFLGAAIFGIVAIVGTVLHVPVVGLCVALGVATVVIFFVSLAAYPRVTDYFVGSPPRVTRAVAPQDRSDTDVAA